MYADWGERVDFLTVYIKEAHPDNEWASSRNAAAGIHYEQPESLEERLVIARDFVDCFEYSLPLVVDSIDDAAMDAYAGWPERLYVIAADGSIAYKGGMGPMFFDPECVEAWLRANVGPNVNSGEPEARVATPR